MKEHRILRDRIGAVVSAVALSAVLCAQPAGAADDVASHLVRVADKSGDADLRELSRYELTMADVRKWAAASTQLKQHAEPEGDDENDDDGDDARDQSLDEMAARIERTPAARKAIEGAGLTARQYAVITMAFMQAAFAQAAVEAGADPAKVARDAHVNPANLRFVKEHKAELEKMKDASGGE